MKRKLFKSFASSYGKTEEWLFREHVCRHRELGKRANAKVRTQLPRADTTNVFQFFLQRPKTELQIGSWHLRVVSDAKYLSRRWKNVYYS